MQVRRFSAFLCAVDLIGPRQHGLTPLWGEAAGELDRHLSRADRADLSNLALFAALNLARCSVACFYRYSCLRRLID